MTWANVVPNRLARKDRELRSLGRLGLGKHHREGQRSVDGEETETDRLLEDVCIHAHIFYQGFYVLCPFDYVVPVLFKLHLVGLDEPLGGWTELRRS